MNISINEKRPYEAPQLTVVSFKTERGYAGSVGEINGLNNVILGEMLSSGDEGDYADLNGYGWASSSVWD
ncbi:MAG: hypothetical protein IJT39_04400 [Bacteroidales bacterium]|nr:hypothetical protein [Bacteroidales bacterium]